MGDTYVLLMRRLGGVVWCSDQKQQQQQPPPSAAATTATTIKATLELDKLGIVAVCIAFCYHLSPIDTLVLNQQILYALHTERYSLIWAYIRGIV